MKQAVSFSDLTCRLSSSGCILSVSLAVYRLATMAQRLRDSAQKINWTPEPMRPELLHFFDLPSISSLAQSYKSFDFVPPTLHFEEIPSSPERMPIRTPRPPLDMRNAREMVLTYHRSRKAPACKHADPSPSSGASNPPSEMACEKDNRKGKIKLSPSQLPSQGNDLKHPRAHLEVSDTEIPRPLSLSHNGASGKCSAALLFPDNIPKLAKRGRKPQGRSKRIGWVNTGSFNPWAMVAHASLIKPSDLPQKTSLNIGNPLHIPYNLRRRKHSTEADAQITVICSFKSAPPDQPLNGKRKLTVSLLSNEIEEDFMKMTGEMPLQKPNKRPKKTQSRLDVSIRT